ncbi:DUF2934 domain-containing protein [Thiohalobacter sp. IOR34]|uniref:DUF2934 domain-containing protein n=1 Tax=Thiohalobacter sp. IOR34 TaxID=3057176 RepID=UPI0025AFE358|nr:DUF2934 domain-containing protein [Thiohalobacter sp. IOR34]WJW76109.1 DUF2934 domain-containing protein [Thiohalobacter sp. IOR34]
MTTTSKQPRRKSPAKTAAKSSKAASTKTTRRRKTAAKTPEITPEQRYQMIAEVAYLRAERQGFAGDPVEDWLAAEKEVDAGLAGRAAGTAQ